MKRLPVLFALAALLLCLATIPASAIPAFARKYDMSCMTCHAPIPRLKAYGEEFAGNGFQLADKEAPRFVRETGDDELLLMRELPLALRLEGYGRWQPQDAGRSDFEAPYLLKFLSGGLIARDVSYYFYFFFDERGEVAGIEDAFLMFNNLFASELEVTVGQFQVSDPLFKRELRLTLEDYQVYRQTVGRSRIRLVYDRGLMFSYGFATGTDIVAGVVNGAGIGGMDDTRTFDADRFKNTFFRISQDVAEGVRVGAFAYFGREGADDTLNSAWIAGPDLTLSTGPLELNLQYLVRRDDDPSFVYQVKQTKTNGVTGELVFTPDGDQSRWYGAALYNWVEIRPGDYKYHTATGHLSYMLARNLRVLGEYTYDFEQKANRVSVGFVSAF